MQCLTFDADFEPKSHYRLAEKIHQIKLKAKTKAPCISVTQSSSQSSSLVGEHIEVKVEVTPPNNNSETSSLLLNSYSMDSTMDNCSLALDCKTAPGTCPQQRKLTDQSHDARLNSSSHGRFTPSPSSGSSCKKVKKFEELMDLSSPYNYYRCLSPSESNLTKCNDAVAKHDNKPGSSRLLRRQFSLDKEDCHAHVSHRSNLDVPFLNEQRSTPSPTSMKPGRLHRQTSASVAQDLEKIEEIPISPTSGLSNHKSDIHLSQITDFANDALLQSTSTTIMTTKNTDTITNSNNNVKHCKNQSDRNDQRELSLNVKSLMNK